MNTEKQDSIEPKKSLMNSFERLNQKIGLLAELENLSDRLLKKFTNPYSDPDPDPKPVDKMMDKDKGAATKHPDLVDLFNLTAENMANHIQNIGNKLDRLLNMVE